MEERTASASSGQPAPSETQRDKETTMTYQAPEFLELGKVQDLTFGCELLFAEGTRGRIFCIP